MLLGAANAVYHPADYSILGSVIDPSRLGRAFSWHTFSGYLGGAMAPIVMLALTDRWGMQAAIAAPPMVMRPGMQLKEELGLDHFEGRS